MSLLSESERELDSLKHELVSQNVSNNSGLKDIERRHRKWERKSRLLNKMMHNFNQASESYQKLHPVFVVVVNLEMNFMIKKFHKLEYAVRFSSYFSTT